MTHGHSGGAPELEPAGVPYDACVVTGRRYWGRSIVVTSPPARQLHLLVLGAFTEAGRPPSRAGLERAARAAGADPDAVLAELSDHDLVAFGEDGEIRAAYPFSPAPSPVQVSWDGGPVVYAMCAVDALGMSAMLGRPVQITGSEPESERVITVAVDDDKAHWDPETAVVFSGAARNMSCGASADRTCRFIHFFSAEAAAQQWEERHPEATGLLLNQEEALSVGIGQFGALISKGQEGTG
jgi:hypothetical protein